MELERSVIVQDLLKHFNARDFAKTLLPRSEPHELSKFNEDETTNCEVYLDNLEENSDLHGALLENSELENVRVWSKVAFKEQQPKIFKDIISETPCEIKQNLDSTSSSITGIEVAPCLKREEINSDNFIRNFLHEESEYKGSDSGGIFQDPPLAESGTNCFRFFYMNATENLFGDNKTVHLFGKMYSPQVHGYTSCCVAVGPLKRRLYVLPCSKVIGDDSHAELLFNEKQILEEFYCVAMKPLKIMKFNFRFLRKRNMDNSLGLAEVLLLEIEYSSQYPPVDKDVKGASFCKVYGVKTKLYENFLLEKKIRGPCWLDVSSHRQATKLKTWCHKEIMCTPEEINLTDINLKLHVPPLTLLSMHIRSVESICHRTKEIVFISWAVCRNFKISGASHSNCEKSYCGFVSPEKEKPLPKICDTFQRTSVLKMNSEKNLLDYFIEEYYKIDPDILVGYDFKSREVCNLVDRLVSLNINNFSRLSRFRGSPKHTNLKAFIFSGRVICDFKWVAKDFIFSKQYALNTLYEKILNISNEQRCSNRSIVFSPDVKLLETIVNTTNESIYLLRLAIKSYVIPLVFKLSNICGTSLSQTLSGGLSKRSEFLLLFAFHERGYFLPDRTFNRVTDDNEEFLGGLVLDPKEGFYENYILLMDFQSLYPSIIQEYNLCLSLSQNKAENSPLGVIPSLMKQLTEKRQRVKTIMNQFDKQSDLYFRYQVYQSALKLSSNGIYGCLGSRFFRFYCPSMAAEIAERAREILSNSVQILQSQGFEIIYGDTDSMMINTKSKDFAVVLNFGEQINSIINRHFSFIKLRVDSIFQRILIVGKKKYAGIAVHNDLYSVEELKYETILKGVDVIRTDWPSYVCEIGKVAIDYILSDISFQDKVSKIKELLNHTKLALLSGQVPIQSLVITKCLTEDPKNYKTQYRFPHVDVALRCNEESVFYFRKGDSVSYVMCCNEDSSKKAFHLSELKRYPGWKIDSLYYLHEKIYPMIWRICSCLEGMGIEIEYILGEKYIRKDSERVRDIPKIKKIKFDEREPFTFKCIKCEHMNVVVVGQTIKRNLKLLSCQNPDCSFCPLKNPKYLRNQLVLAIRRYIKVYYTYNLSCRNIKCGNSSRIVPLNAIEIKDNCSLCKKGTLKPKFNEMDLFLQLKYFRHIFDTELSLSTEQWMTNAYNSLIKILDNYDKFSDFHRVSVTELFSNF